MEISNQDKQKLIDYLNFVCDYEASKPIDEMNEELIDSCVNVLLELQDKHVTHSPEFIEEQVRKIFRKGETEISVPEAVKPTKKRINKKKVWLVAACIAILVALFSVVSVANDWNVFDFLSEKFGSVHSAPIEEELDFNGVTVVMNGKNVNFQSIEEALKEQKLDVLYPSTLPNSIEIDKITLYEENSADKLSYSFNDVDLYAEISFNASVSQEVINDATETKTINSIKCYICELPELNCTQITFAYKDDTYKFGYTDKKVLLDIIETLEEINNEN